MNPDLDKGSFPPHSCFLPPNPVVERLTCSPSRYPRTAGVLPERTALLHLNETPLPPSPLVIEAVAAATLMLNRYPTPAEPTIVAALAALNNVDCAQIFLGAGSDELVQYIVAAFAGEETVVVSPDPAFPKYRQSANLYNLGWRGVVLDADGLPDPTGLAFAAQEANAAIMFISSPHNPTGGTWTVENYQRLAADCPSRTLVVVDAAYGEFATCTGGGHLVQTLSATQMDWVILRTFSKAYGLAGARIGYGIAKRPEVAEAIRRIVPVFSVNSLALAAASAALSDEGHLKAVVTRNRLAREEMRLQLVSLGLRVLPSEANFLAVDLGQLALPVATNLRSQQILVSGINHPDYENYIRVSIGSDGDNDRFLDAIKTLIGKEKYHDQFS